jgi:hypothetical protein
MARTVAGIERVDMNAQLYFVARSALLDALEALHEQRDAVILVGAQAIYIHTGDADIAVPAYTTDGDLLLEPARLKDEPKLAEAMERAEFRRGSQPGSWLCEREVDSVMTTIPVDLLVPQALAGGRGRGARLGPHGDRVGRQTRGMEAAVVDHTPHRLTSLSAGDPRVFHIRLAGPAALLVAKLHKLSDRSQERTAKRMKDKDALDVLRILRAVPSEVLKEVLNRLRHDDLAGTVTHEALDYLRTLFGSRAGLGTQMAVRATERLADPETIAASCEALATDLLQELAGTTR